MLADGCDGLLERGYRIGGALVERYANAELLRSRENDRERFRCSWIRVLAQSLSAVFKTSTATHSAPIRLAAKAHGSRPAPHGRRPLSPY